MKTQRKEGKQSRMIPARVPGAESHREPLKTVNTSHVVPSQGQFAFYLPFVLQGTGLVGYLVSWISPVQSCSHFCIREELSHRRLGVLAVRGFTYTRQ